MENDNFKCIFKRIKTFKLDLINFYIISMSLLVSFILLSLFM